MISSPIHVLVVDDHQMVRRGLAAHLLTFKDLALAGKARNGAEALGLCATAQPDVVLLDLLMPDIDGAEATRAIRERYPNIRVIVLTNWNEYRLVQRALAAGAESYLLKSDSAVEVADTIRTVCSAPMQDPTPPPEQYAELTARECEVLELMARGLTNEQIGAHLIISRATVKFHVSSILSKLGAATRTEAVALATQSHLTTGPR